MKPQQQRYLNKIERNTILAEMDTLVAMCFCPMCKSPYGKKIEFKHYSSDYSFKFKLLFVVLCDKCRSQSNHSIYFTTKEKIPIDSYSYELVYGGFSLWPSANNQ